jgi:hypothetical protein
LPYEPLLEPLLPVEVPAPVLGEVGDVVLLEPLLMPEELPLPMLDVPPEAPPELELDLLKCASHSAREIWPSLFVSTSEKLGCEELPETLELPPLAAGEDDEDGVLLDEPEVLLLPLDDGEVADGVLDEVDGLLDDDEDDWATASDDSANITAAAVTLRVLGMRRSPDGWKKLPPDRRKRCAHSASAVWMSEDQPTHRAPFLENDHHRPQEAPSRGAANRP